MAAPSLERFHTDIHAATLATHRRTSPEGRDAPGLRRIRAAQQSDLPRHHGDLGCLLHPALGPSPRAPRDRALGRPVLRGDARPRASSPLPEANLSRPAPFVCREPGPPGAPPGARQARRPRRGDRRTPGRRGGPAPAASSSAAASGRRARGVTLLGSVAALLVMVALASFAVVPWISLLAPVAALAGVLVWLRRSAQAERAARRRAAAPQRSQSARAVPSAPPPGGPRRSRRPDALRRLRRRRPSGRARRAPRPTRRTAPRTSSTCARASTTSRPSSASRSPSRQPRHPRPQRRDAAACHPAGRRRRHPADLGPGPRAAAHLTQ